MSYILKLCLELFRPDALRRWNNSRLGRLRARNIYTTNWQHGYAHTLGLLVDDIRKFLCTDFFLSYALLAVTLHDSRIFDRYWEAINQRHLCARCVILATR